MNSANGNNPITQPLAADQAHSVSIVIPTYDNLSLLLECLESVRHLDYPREKLEIVVVDNASSDHTPAVVAERYPYVKLVRLESNTGFAVACNMGVAEASGEYVAFLNNDAVAGKDWINALFAGLNAGGEGAVCAASRIVSRDGGEVEYNGAASNLFAAARPTSVWGWPDRPQPPGEGSPLLFASGGAMLIHRQTFLEVGGFDPAYFAYFEDVDLGWRLWTLGHRVVYAPGAVVRHIGGATGKRTASHRRYTLWECNSLATVLKNYESGNMEKILSAALMLEYKRAIMAAGDAFNPQDYLLTGPPDSNQANVERLPKVSVAHIAAIDRLLAMLPHLMEERQRIQANRVRSDSEILPLLGRAYEPQFAGTPYADAVRALASAMQLYDITAPTAPNRVLIIAGDRERDDAIAIVNRLKEDMLVAVVQVGEVSQRDIIEADGYTVHTLATHDSRLEKLIRQADALIVLSGVTRLEAVREATVPTAIIGSIASNLPRAIAVSDAYDPALIAFCRAPQARIAAL